MERWSYAQIQLLAKIEEAYREVTVGEIREVLEMAQKRFEATTKF